MTERFDGHEADMSKYRYSGDFEPVGGSGMSCEAQPKASRANPQSERRSLPPRA